MKKKKIVVMRSCIASLSCLYLMICSSCGNPRNGESKNEDNTKEIEIVKKEPITYNFYVENSGSVKGYFIIRKTKCSGVSEQNVPFFKTKRTSVNLFPSPSTK